MTEDEARALLKPGQSLAGHCRCCGEWLVKHPNEHSMIVGACVDCLTICDHPNDGRCALDERPQAVAENERLRRDNARLRRTLERITRALAAEHAS